MTFGKVERGGNENQNTLGLEKVSRGGTCSPEV